jgi:transcriptional regulator GlxA family with amidase domain
VLARIAGLSNGHLTRQFAQWAGQTPRRLRAPTFASPRRRSLLTRGELSVKEIAIATGFKNTYHFSRVFRQIDGLSPTLYRETRHPS